MIMIIIIIINCTLIQRAIINKLISNALDALCQYVANRKHLSERLKESRTSDSSLRYSGIDCSMQTGQRSELVRWWCP